MKSLFYFLVLSVCLQPAVAQTTGGCAPPNLSAPLTSASPTVPQPPDITTVTRGYDARGRMITRLEINLQNAPCNQEPVAEPRAIRVDDRAHVQFLLRNLSPLDVCSRSASPPTQNQETAPIESLVTSVAGVLGGGGGGGAAPGGGGGAAPMCHVTADPEYAGTPGFDSAYKDFMTAASNFVGKTDAGDAKCPPEHPGPPTQLDLACKIDGYSRLLANYAGRDYRRYNWNKFDPLNDSELEPVRARFMNQIETIQSANVLQAELDLLKAYQKDLHAKHDFQVPAGGNGPPPPPVIPGALMVGPTALSFSTAGDKQMIMLTTGGEAAPFTAEASSDTGWLLITPPGGTPSAGKLTGSTTNHGDFDLAVTVNDSVIKDAATHYGAIVIKGTGNAKGTTIIDVVVKPAGGPSGCDLTALQTVDQETERAAALISVITANNAALQAGQAALKTSYTALVKVQKDFEQRARQHIVEENFDLQGHPYLVQVFDLGTDRKDTSTGYLQCVSDVNMTTPTTTNINYTLVYQDVPQFSASAGFLVSLQPNQIYGLITPPPSSSNPTPSPYFDLTTNTPAQIFPMAFLNYRPKWFYHQAAWYSHWGSTHENELLSTLNASAGFGVNPDTGTNQPEFFTGLAYGWNHFLLHAGAHYAHTETLGDGYTPATTVPTTLTTPPLNWGYHVKFSFGFSVRVAPY